MCSPFPQYMDGLEGDALRSARCRYLIRLAALHYSPSGKVNTLSSGLGLAPNTLAQADTVTPELAVKLEEALGRKFFPRELFRPDVFIVAGA